MGTPYTVVYDRLTPESRQLLKDMVEIHLAAGSATNRFFMDTSTMAGTWIAFAGGDRHTELEVDKTALNDLVDYGLLRREHAGRHGTRYQVSAEALAFHRWMRDHEGAPIDQVHGMVHRLVDAGEFARRHADAAHHLRKAFRLVHTDGATGAATAREIGVHLRSAVIDTLRDLTRVESDVEDHRAMIIELLAQRAADRGAARDRDGDVIAALVELASKTQALNQRIAHLPDTIAKGEPPLSWDEVRRAAFVTALCCHELDRA